MCVCVHTWAHHFIFVRANQNNKNGQIDDGLRETNISLACVSLRQDTLFFIPPFSPLSLICGRRDGLVRVSGVGEHYGCKWMIG